MLRELPPPKDWTLQLPDAGDEPPLDFCRRHWSAAVCGHDAGRYCQEPGCCRLVFGNDEDAAYCSDHRDAEAA